MAPSRLICLSLAPLAAFAALGVLARLPAAAEYQKAAYPQTAPLVRSISVSCASSAKPGSELSVSLSVDAVSALPEGTRVYLCLNKGGVTWEALDFDPQPAAAAWKPGVTKIRALRLPVPADIAPGDYQLVAGVHQQAAQGSRPVKITGEVPSRPGKIITRGRMVDKYGVPHEWRINRAHALIWDGRPWMPAGGMFVYGRDWNVVKAQLDLLKKYGVRSLYLHLGVNQPYVWKTYSDDDYKFFQQTIDYLDEQGFTYGLEFQALEAKGPGYYYPAPGPRKDVTGSGTVTMEQDKTLGGYFAVFERDTWDVVQTGRARVSDNKKIEADVQVPKDGSYQVVFALEREAPGMYSMYYWDDKYPQYLDVVRKHYSKVNLGPGFRFLVDPLWNEMNMNRDFYPSAPTYYKQFEEWLVKRYGTLAKLNEAWDPVSPVASFEQAARLIPLDRKDIPPSGHLHQFLMDPQDQSTLALDLTTSQYNYDAMEFLGRSLLHYTCDIADEFKKLYDVPVIYKGFSDMDFWHINDLGTPGGHDGLGMESYGTGEPMMMFMAAHLYGELEQATKTTWLVVTETGEGNHQDNSPSRNKAPGYTSRLGTMYANYNALISGGAKGVFQYNMVPSEGTNDPWTDALTADVRQLEWLGTYDRILGSAPALADYKPAMYFRFPGMYNPNSMSLSSEPNGDYYGFGGWWWREPVERSENDIWIVPSFSLRPDTPMFIVSLENRPASERHRDELVKAVKDGVRITMIGFRKDLGEIPEIDRYYTDVFREDADGRKFQVLKPTPTSRVLDRCARTGEPWNLLDGNLQINSKQVFGLHGYRPDNLETGGEANPDPYTGVFEELLGARVLDLGPDLHGLTFLDGDVPVTVAGLTGGQKRTVSFSIPAGSRVSASYPGGEPAGEMRSGKLVVDLQPVDRKLIRVDQWPGRDQNPWVRNGVLVDSTAARDSVVIRGLPAANSVPAEAAREVIARADAASRALEEDERGDLPKIVASARTSASAGRYAEAIATATEKVDAFFSARSPYVWIEAEDRIASNFNYSRLGGLPNLSGQAFLGLETAVEPPADTGWYATFKFTAPAEATYQLWMRENYLAYSSACSWRVDGGPWQKGSGQFVPRDTSVISLYNAVEDTRQVFAWYHYGATRITKGTHTLTIRVDTPRGKGLAVTMSDDRQYAKLVDCLLLTARAFDPEGFQKPRTLKSRIEPVAVNLLSDPSFEFRPDSDAKSPKGWKPSEEGDGLVWQDAGWGAYNVMPGLDINLGQRFAYAGQRNLTIKAGAKERWWVSDPVPVKPGFVHNLQAAVRAVDLGAEAVVEVIFQDSMGAEIATLMSEPVSGDADWTSVNLSGTAPVGSAFAAVRCRVTAGDNGLAYFDDVYFWQSGLESMEP